MNRTHIAIVAVVCAAALDVGTRQIVAQSRALPEVLKESIAYYSTLVSYADTGTVRQEVPGIVEESKFMTYFRRPTRDLYFEFQGLTSMNPVNRHTIDMTAYRNIIWMFNGNMQQYDFKSRSHEVVPSTGGRQVQTLQTTAHSTRGTSILVSAMLYSQAQLPGAVLQIEEARLAGTERVGQHPCHKVVGIAAQRLPNGRRINPRPVTVWIDTQSRLIRRVFEDTPTDYPGDVYLRLTTTLEPRANPPIEDARFRFTPPR